VGLNRLPGIGFDQPRTLAAGIDDGCLDQLRRNALPLPISVNEEAHDRPDRLLIDPAQHGGAFKRAVLLTGCDRAPPNWEAACIGEDSGHIPRFDERFESLPIALVPVAR
jgi:hypothetical protein